MLADRKAMRRVRRSKAHYLGKIRDKTVEKSKLGDCTQCSCRTPALANDLVQCPDFRAGRLTDFQGALPRIDQRFLILQAYGNSIALRKMNHENSMGVTALQLQGSMLQSNSIKPQGALQKSPDSRFPESRQSLGMGNMFGKPGLGRAAFQFVRNPVLVIGDQHIGSPARRQMQPGSGTPEPIGGLPDFSDLAVRNSSSMMQRGVQPRNP